MSQNTNSLFIKVALLLEQRLLGLREVPEQLLKQREAVVLKHTQLTANLTPVEKSQLIFALELLTKMADSTEDCTCRDCGTMLALKKIVLETKTDGNPSAEWKHPDS